MTAGPGISGTRPRWSARATASNGRFLIDQGTADPFLSKQLRPELFEAACAEAGQPLELARRDGYDHGYFFVSSFMERHLRWHHQRLTE